MTPHEHRAAPRARRRRAQRYDLFAYGNAMVDYVVRAEEGLLKKLGLRKGAATYVAGEQAERVLQEVRPLRPLRTPGGSATNVTAGVVSLGGSAFFTGAVGRDRDGSLYRRDLDKRGIHHHLLEREGTTGTVIAFLTPDRERSFACIKGVADRYAESDLPDEVVGRARVVHATAYELQDNPKTVFSLFRAARKAGVMVSFDLASPNIAQSERRKIAELLQWTSVVFANEEEAQAFAGLPLAGALRTLGARTDLAVVKVGARGAFVVEKGVSTRIPAFRARVVDTNGAGDGFAAGFLWGRVRGKSPQAAARIGALYASHVVARKGPRLKGRFPLREALKRAEADPAAT